ncbi:hypothetical protein KKB44_04745 [Candidatus Micrarchaeota archaeon]|nr:hypothetical protein [Candidatus Micrarchaeota archaeon]
MDKNIPIYLALGFTHIIFLFLVFIIPGMVGTAIPFSFNAFIEPFFGDKGLIYSLFVVLLIMDMSWFHFNLLPKALEIKDPKAYPMVLSVPSIFGIFGLVITSVEANSWVALPFIFLGFAHYVYAYTKITQ